MRLLRLTLENWRGISHREIEFADGVTLIEGPNEIGKSTLIEALQLLFRELHSSKSKKVKAVQPTGQDVGSRVEVEVRMGEHHFVFSKVYNRSAQTSLRVLTPNPGQHTGREAHNLAQGLLAENMDMALWDALLVDQGERIGLANLQKSSGLAQALDEAAGQTQSPSQQASDAAEDHNVFEAVQAEYERYFTLKTNKPKPAYAQPAEAVAQAEADLQEAELALQQVQDNVQLEQQQRQEVQRLTAALPQLQNDLETHDAAWQAVLKLQEQSGVKHKEWQTAQTIASNAARAHQQRQDLLAAIANGAKQEQDALAQQAPLTSQVKALTATIQNAVEQERADKQKVALARKALTLAEADAKHLQNTVLLEQGQAKQQHLQRIEVQLKTQLQVSTAILVDETALKALQAADRELEVTRRTRETAATRVSITTATDQQLKLNDELLQTGKAQAVERTITSELTVELPGIAHLTISPPRSAAEHDLQADSAQTHLRAQLERLQVPDLASATVQFERRADALASVKALRSEQQQHLQGTSLEKLNEDMTIRQQRCEQYLATRSDTTPIATDNASAAQRITQAAASVAEAEQQLERTRDQQSAARATFDEQDGLLRAVQQQLAGVAAALSDRQQSLNSARSESDDETLEQQVKESAANAALLAAEISALDETLAASAPEAAQALRDNAEDVLRRVTNDLAQAQQLLAVQTDRLQQAQANGLFERWEHAGRALEDSRAALAATEQRANAARKLWDSINQHRDAAREAYVAPLKQALERLGQIVFGSTFAVVINDDWSIASRTLNQTTLPFEDLSIGAKEQLAILMRLAAAQIVAKQGGVPLLLDDALGFSDPGRLATMGAAIAAAGKTCQIIILSCAPGRFTHVGNAKVIRLQDSQA